jgi:hypothetical protein
MVVLSRSVCIACGGRLSSGHQVGGCEFRTGPCRHCSAGAGWQPFLIMYPVTVIASGARAVHTGRGRMCPASIYFAYYDLLNQISRAAHASKWCAHRHPMPDRTLPGDAFAPGRSQGDIAAAPSGLRGFIQHHQYRCKQQRCHIPAVSYTGCWLSPCMASKDARLALKNACLTP